MLLQYYPVNFQIPHTSKCYIQQQGNFHDRDKITVISPVFNSIGFTSGSINLASDFEVTLRIDMGYDVDKELVLPAVNCPATLVCDDNDIFNMYVKL